MLVILVLTYLMCIFDYVMTYHWIKKFGIEVEANPFGRVLFTIADGFGAFFVKVIMSFAILATFYIFNDTSLAKIATIGVFFTYLALTIYHIYIIIKVYRSCNSI